MGKYSEKHAKLYLKAGLISLIPFIVLFVSSIHGLPYSNWGRFEIDKGMIMGISATFSSFFIMLPYRTWKSGLNGERTVIKNISDKLSSEYSIFNDVLLADGKRKGDIDHLIVGPTGIFVVETKNNKETVSYNGYKWMGITKNPSNQVEVNAFRLKDLLKYCEVFENREPYVNAIVVFSNKKVTLNLSHEENLKWSKIIKLNNQADMSLSNYITNKSVIFTLDEIGLIEQFIIPKISNFDKPL